MIRTEQELEIIKLAFLEELEKNADFKTMAVKGLASLFNFTSRVAPTASKTQVFASNAGKAFGKSFEEGAAYVGKFKTPEFVKGTSGWTQAARNAPKEADGYLAKKVGDLATEFGTFGKGVSAEKGIFNKSKKVLDNFVTDTKRQINSATKKVMTPDKYVGEAFNKKTILGNKSKHQYVKTRLGTARKIVGRDAAGNPIVSRGLLPKALALSFTPVGMGAMSAMSGDKEDGVKDYLAWKTPVGMWKMNYDLLKDGANFINKKKNNENNDNEQQNFNQ